MRILDNSTATLDLEDLGFEPDTLERVRQLVQQTVRHDPGGRADRFGKVDDAVFDAERPEPAGRQHRHL